MSLRHDLIAEEIQDMGWNRGGGGGGDLSSRWVTPNVYKEDETYVQKCTTFLYSRYVDLSPF